MVPAGSRKVGSVMASLEQLRDPARGLRTRGTNEEADGFKITANPRSSR